MRVDSAGGFWNIASGAVIGGVISAGMELTAQVVEHKLCGSKIDWDGVGLAATGLDVRGQMIGSTLISGVSKAVSQVRSGNRNIQSFLVDLLDIEVAFRRDCFRRFPARERPS